MEGVEASAGTGAGAGCSSCVAVCVAALTDVMFGPGPRAGFNDDDWRCCLYIMCEPGSRCHWAAWVASEVASSSSAGAGRTAMLTMVERWGICWS